MATATNDITGALMKTKPVSVAYEKGWDAIDWNKKGEQEVDSESSNQILTSSPGLKARVLKPLIK
jgi:hypothetical protein